MDWVELIQINGRWYPAQATLIHVFQPKAREPEVADLRVVTMQVNIESVTPLSEPQPDEVFDFAWPAGTRVDDRIAGFSYTQLKEGRLTNPLDRMVHQLLLAQPPSGDAKLGGAARSGAALGIEAHLETLGIATGLDAASVSLPRSVCAIGCAYAILKLEGQAAVTTRSLMDELRAKESGRVAPELLADTLRSHGLVVNSFRGLTTDLLRKADAREGLYLMLLTRSGGTGDADTLDHAMLYRGTGEDGNLVVVNPPGVGPMRPELLRERWAGGYVVVAARTPRIMDEFIRTIQTPWWRRVLPALGVILLVAALGAVGSKRKPRARSAAPPNAAG